MALKQNGVLLNQMPLRFRGFDLGARDQFARSRAWFFGQNSEDPKSGIPDGNLAPCSWMLPQKPGAMNGRNSAALSIGLTGSGAMGVNGVGTASIVFSADATGQLIVSGAGTASFSITATGNAVATLNGIGAASFVISGSGVLGALASTTGTATMTFTGTLVPYARGFMSGSTVDNTVLTTAGIAAEVWNSIATAFNSAGTMGAKLNSAASGGVDYAALAAAVLAAAQADPIAANIKEVNSIPVDGAGTEADPFGPA